MKLVALLGAVLFIATAHVNAQQNFASPEEAARALAAAARAGDTKSLLAVLGPEAKAIAAAGDPAANRAARERFVKAYEQANRVEIAGRKATLVIGDNGWTFPIPLVQGARGWSFDVRQGREEILNRRIGQNELNAIEAVRAYVDAQREYYLRNPADDKLLQYAQRIRSSEGKRDGLYYETKPGEAPSPLGGLYNQPVGAPYHGYRYRILRAQGPAAPGGAYNYVANGKMIGGFAMVAYPAAYGTSGVMSFIINHDGAVYEKDLGPQGAELAVKMTRFNPDKSWKRL